MNKVNKDIFDLFDSYEPEPSDLENYKISPERISRLTLQKIEKEKKRGPIRRRSLRVALLAAVIACFMSVTAYAAFFRMHYEYVDRDGTYNYQYWTVDGYEEGSYTVNSYMVSFDTQPEGCLLAFRANWLPSEPTYAGSLYQEAKDMAREALGIALLPETSEEQAKVNAAMDGIFQEMGVTAEEAQEWNIFLDADQLYDPDFQDTLHADIPYQVRLCNNSDLYQCVFAIGDDQFNNEGVQVDFLRDEIKGDWHEIWVHVDESETEHAKNFSSPLDITNMVLRFNQAEGYLIFVPGTLEPEVLHKIAENVEVLRTDYPTLSEGGKIQNDFFSLGHG